MKVFVIIYLLFIFHSSGIFAEDKTTCNKEDELICFKNILKQTIKDIVNGIPDYNINPLDPLEISDMDFKTTQDTIFHFTDLKIYGLRDLEILWGIFSQEPQSAEIQMKFALNITANMAIEFTDINKSIRTIIFRAKTNSLTMTLKANYNVSNVDGVKHIAIFDETTSCQATKDPVVNLDADLDKILREDPDLQHKIQNFNKKELRVWKDLIICKMGEVAVSNVIVNFKILTKKVRVSE